jgi:tellurite methyltransferase
MGAADRDKWDERYRAGSHSGSEPSPFLVSLADRLPRSGRALDVAGGAGRNALWLARRGLDVTIADVSEVGLSLAAERAGAEGLTLTTERRDFEENGLPPGPWDVIVSAMFLQRSLFAAYPEQLAPGGMVVVLQPTTTNLERHAKPPRPFLLEPGELAELASDLELLSLDESWSDDGFHEARLLARKE